LQLHVKITDWIFVKILTENMFVQVRTGYISEVIRVSIRIWDLKKIIPQHCKIGHSHIIQQKLHSHSADGATEYSVTAKLPLLEHPLLCG